MFTPYSEMTEIQDCQRVRFQNIISVTKIKLQAGDRILLASNYLDQEWACGQNGIKNPIIITTISWDASGVLVPATVDFKESLMAFLFKIAVILKYQIWN
jgi:hypothetical protein